MDDFHCGEFSKVCGNRERIVHLDELVADRSGRLSPVETFLLTPFDDQGHTWINLAKKPTAGDVE